MVTGYKLDLPLWTVGPGSQIALSQREHAGLE